jgi:hypothetical protein
MAVSPETHHFSSGCWVMVIVTVREVPSVRTTRPAPVAVLPETLAGPLSVALVTSLTSAWVSRVE